VTGSARLDHYSKGGDSLQGRYNMHRLHPFSLGELSGTDLESLLELGGFPEPLLKGQKRFWRRWQRERAYRVVHDDIRDLENVREIGKLDLLMEELPRRVGSPLSVENLRGTLGGAHDTVLRWLEIFERMYVCFRIPPYGAPRIRAVRKEQKLYLWDWSLVPDPGPRFENLVASHLLKLCHFVEDTEGYRMELRYIRDTDRREVDFVVLRDRQPLFAVECKTGERSVSPHVFYFKERTDIPRFYQVHQGERDYEKKGVRVLPFAKFSELVGLV
jgi:predicted AAA+ superfamily ATPase